jgi:hypothetical protein
MSIFGTPTRLQSRWLLACLLGVTGSVMGSWWCADARDLVAPKEQSTTEIDPTQSPSFDEQRKGIPQSLFTWIKMAKGYDVEWDSFGRKGWYTQDPRLKPIEPTSVFTPETPAIYIVFEVAPLEDPAQFSAQWFLETDGGKIPDAPVGKDSLEVPGHERYGFLGKTTSGRSESIRSSCSSHHWGNSPSTPPIKWEPCGFPSSRNFPLPPPLRSNASLV